MPDWTHAQKIAALGLTPANAAADAAYDAVADPRVAAVLGVLAPDRVPIFDWGHETTPTADELIELATEIVAAIDRS